jgi:hypothetical protein
VPAESLAESRRAEIRGVVREEVREQAARPAFVTQRSVEQVIGLPRREYLRLAREGAWLSTHERRLVFSRTADVAAYFELKFSTSKAPAANDADAETIAFARVGARRVSR